jgi:soluble lytic murein transglycosylase
MLAARRLDQAPWVPAAGTPVARMPDVDAAMARAALLERLGLNGEATEEYDWLAGEAATSTERMLATAQAFSDAGLASRSIRLARAALDRGAPPSAAVYRLLYPFTYGDVLRAESEARKLDPALVAALVRQESYFTPRATSAVGARGLMQVMPDVGRQIAGGLGFPFWDPVLLYQPDVNAQLGTRHLARALGKYDELAYALAAYNAGDARVTRWSRKAGVRDPELFVERIPYVETRDYVRVILRGRELYRGLYEW